MSEPLTADRLASLAEKHAQYQGLDQAPTLLTETGMLLHAATAFELAAAVPELLDALRWRNVVNEPPPVGIPVLVDDGVGIRRAMIDRSLQEWFNSGLPVLPQEEWLPLPPK